MINTKKNRALQSIALLKYDRHLNGFAVTQPSMKNLLVKTCVKNSQGMIIIHDWMGKAIPRELSKKLKFDNSVKWYMHKPESVLKNETHKILSDFEIETGYLNSPWRPDHVIVDQRVRENLPTSGLPRPGRSLSENQRKWKERHLLRPKKASKEVMEYESDCDTNCNWCTRIDTQRMIRGLEELEIGGRTETI